MKDIIIKIGLTVLIVILGYMVVNSIMQPVKFDNEKTRRDVVVINQLKDIRDIQVAYKGINNEYTGSFDTLVDFLINGELPVVNIIPDPNDTTFTKTINDTTHYVSVQESLFGERENFAAKNIQFIPFSNGQKFTLDADVIEINKVRVPVFEVTAKYEQILLGLDEQLIQNLIKKQNEFNKFPGLKVGSLTEASTDGNWEF